MLMPRVLVKAGPAPSNILCALSLPIPTASFCAHNLQHLSASPAAHKRFLRTSSSRFQTLNYTTAPPAFHSSPLSTNADGISTKAQPAKQRAPHKLTPTPHHSPNVFSKLDPTTPAVEPKPRSRLRPLKAPLTFTSNAIVHLKRLLAQPDPRLIRVGVKNRGCSGLAYHLDYVEKAGPFDEVVEQDGVRVLIDSKALFSIIGSEMDWQEDKLNSRFVFRNPNIKGQCGCGESFMV